MVTRIAAALVALSVVATPANAAEDRRFDDRGGASIQSRGVGAQLSLTIPLGGRSSDSEQNAPRFDLVAGPSFAIAQRNGTSPQRVATSAVVGLRLIPNRSVTTSFAGQDVASVRLRPAYLDNTSQRPNGGHKLGVSTGGWIAISLGVVAVSTVALFVIATNQDCGPTTGIDCS